jgi:hypothetical protein
MSKIAEHGGEDPQGRHVPLLIWGVEVHGGSAGCRLVVVHAGAPRERISVVPAGVVSRRAGPRPVVRCASQMLHRVVDHEGDEIVTVTVRLPRRVQRIR